MNNGEKFEALTGLCDLCVNENVEKIPVDSRGRVHMERVPEYCRGLQAEGKCKCLKAFFNIWGPQITKEMKFCKKCCESRGVEFQPLFMWMEAKGNQRFCPMRMKAFETKNDRDADCPMKLAKISMKGA